ncbi:MAG TPA: cytochrome c biogenesis protein CcdA [Bellilinea sp.]|nr:cytochrome c biogenesis protein CcdA [Bellilinea sp.]
MKRKIVPALVALLAFLILLPLGESQANTRQAVIYFNEACDECVTYIDGELTDLLTQHGITMRKKDYINQRENRGELYDLNQALGIPLELQSHLATYIDDNRIILQGEPPRHVVETLLTRNDLPDRLLIYSEENGDGSYQAWAFAGPTKTYSPNTPVDTYLNWFEANQDTFPGATAEDSSSQLLFTAVLVTGLIDGINPCAMAILLFFVSFLFTIRKNQRSIAQMGIVYIGAVYVVYFLIGLGLLRASTLVQGHWLGQASAVLLMLLGLTNLLGAIFPNFPIRLEVPSAGKERLTTWMYRATMPASLVLGALMGLESFPCSGGPYVAVLGLLSSQSGYWEGLGYLALYNLMFVLPLIVILALSLNPVIAQKMQAWERSSATAVRGTTGAIMAGLGLVLLLWVL